MEIPAESLPKISLLIPKLSLGGIERTWTALANLWSAQGYQVDMVLFEKGGFYEKELSPNVNIIDLGTSRALKSVSALSKYLKEQNPVFILGAMEHVNLTAIIAGKLAGYKGKVVTSTHNSLSSEKQKGGVRKQLELWLAGKLYPKAYMVTGTSKGTCTDIAETLKIRPNLITMIPFSPLSLKTVEQSKEEIDHPWFQNSDIPIFLSAGRLTHQKNYQSLIRAFRIVRDQVNARLVILGEGEDRLSLEELTKELNLEDTVQLPGAVPNPFPYMAKCNVFVLSSRHEGLPGVLLQAMVCGTSVISTDCPYGPSEILSDGRKGILVPVEDDEALALAMIKALKNPSPNTVEQMSPFFVENIGNMLTDKLFIAHE